MNHESVVAESAAAGYAQGFHRVADGLRVSYRDYPPTGERRAGAAPVLCLHGLTRNARDFEEVAPRIAALGRRVIVAEQRGRGRSDWDPDPARYAPPTYAQDMTSLLDALGIGRVAVVGTSMGGLIAMIMAANDPSRLAGVVLNDIGAQIAPKGLDRIRGYVDGRGGEAASWEEAAARARAINGSAFPGETGDAFWLAFARRLYREDDQGRLRLDYDPAISRGVQAEPPAPQSAEPADLWGLFDALKPVATLVVRGGLSDILTADIAARMAARRPDLEFAVAPNVGHAPMLTEPEAWRALAAFLERID